MVKLSILLFAFHCIIVPTQKIWGWDIELALIFFLQCFLQFSKHWFWHLWYIIGKLLKSSFVPRTASQGQLLGKCEGFKYFWIYLNNRYFILLLLFLQRNFPPYRRTFRRTFKQYLISIKEYFEEVLDRYILLIEVNLFGEKNRSYWPKKIFDAIFLHFAAFLITNISSMKLWQTSAFYRNFHFVVNW